MPEGLGRCGGGRQNHAGERLVENFNRPIELGAGDGEGRSEGEDVSLGDLEVQAAREAVVHHLFSLIGGPYNLSVPGVTQFNADQEPQAPDIDDQRVSTSESAQPFHQIGSEFLGSGGKVLPLDDLKGGQGGGAGDGIFFGGCNGGRRRGRC